MANGVQLATAYISLNVNTANVKDQVREAFKGTAGAGKAAGEKLGSEMSSSIRARLADSSFIKNALQKSTQGTGNRAATGFFQEFRSTSQRLGAVTGLVIGKTIGTGIRGALAAADFGANIFGRMRASAAVMARNVGSMMAGAIGTAVKGVSLGAVGAVGYTLMAGFQRLEKIDQAKGKLIALGNSAQDVEQIMAAANAAVDKTRFSLADAADLAAAAVAAGVKPGKELEKYLTNIADVSAVTGAGLEEIGYVMNQVESSNAAFNDSLQSLQTRGLPVYEWLAQQLGTTTQNVKDLASEGKISAQDFQKAIDTHIGGAAKTMGGTVSSSIDNLRTSVARLGANFLGAILGTDAGGDLANAKTAIDAFTNKIKELEGFVKANKGEIREFFSNAKDAAAGVVNVLRDIGNFLKDIPGGVQGVVTAFLAWKTITSVAALITSLTAIKTLLAVDIPAAAGLSASALGPLAATIGTAVAGYLLLKDNPTFGNKGTFGEGGGFVPPLIGDGPGGLFGPKTAESGVLPGAPGQVGGTTPTIGGIPIPGLQTPGQAGGNGIPILMQPKPSQPGAVRGSPGQGYPQKWSFPTVGRSAGIAPPMSGQGNGAEGWRPTVRSVVQSYGPRYGIPPSAFALWEDALVRQIRTESGGNMNSVNPNDTNGRGGRQRVAGVLNFLESTFNSYNVSGGAYMDPVAQIIAAIPYVVERWGIDRNGGPLQIGRGQGFADGGKVRGPGGPRSDSILARVSNGEYVVRASAVDKHFPLLEAINNNRLPGMAEGGLIDPNLLLDPNNPDHGRLQGAAPGPVDSVTQTVNQTQPDQSNPDQQPNLLDEFIRSGGFVPVAAGNTGVAGTSSIAGILNMGSEIAGSLIDTGASLAQTAATAAIAAGSMGAAAPAAPAGAAAASFGIQTAANIAKRGVSYGFQMAGIGADALIAQLFPFGAPRWIGYDYTQFLPQMGLGQAAVGTLEQMGSNAINNFFKPQQNQNTPAAPQSPASPEDPMSEAAAPAPAPMTAPAPGQPLPPWMQMPGMADGGRIAIYDQGGVLRPGDLALNASRKPERILTDKQWDSLANIAPVGQQPLVKIDAIYGMSPQDVAAKIEDKQRLAMMRYTGRP